MRFDEIVRALELVFGTFGPEDAVAAEELVETERRIGVTLPATLRQLYARTGKHPLHSAENELLTPATLYFDDQFLVFYVGDQEGVWGIRRDMLPMEDPPIFVGFVEGEGTVFTQQFETLSLFFAFQAAWQAIGGALPFVGILHPPFGLGSGVMTTPAVSVPMERFSAIGDLLAKTEGAEVRLCDGSLLLAGSNGYVGVATTTAEGFRQLGDGLGVPLIAWDYATLKEEIERR